MSDLELNLLNSDKIATELSKIKPENLKKILDSKLSNSNESNGTEFDITIFNETDIFSTIDEKITKGRHRDLLSHPLVEAFLLAKWDTIKFWYYLNTLAYFVFIIDLTFLLYFVQFDIAGM